jgi:hypothetical protein
MAANETTNDERLTAAEPYRSAGTLARVVTLLLVAYIVAALLSIGSGYMQLGLLERAGGGHTDFESVTEAHEPISDEEAEANDLRELVVGLLLLAVFLFNVVAFLIWLHRAYSNLTALGNPKQKLDYSPGWAIGAWFIPIINIVLPYRIVREIWAKSDPSIRTADDLQFTPAAPSSLLLAWWLVWVAATVAGNLSFRFTSDVKTPADFIFATKWDIFSTALNIAAAVLAILVVRSIARRQEMRSRNVTYLPLSPPPPVTQP